MLERVVENWLVSLNERQYHIPFCQLLQAEGETILRISRHQADELGVDVLSLSPAGDVKAYQLKRGDVALSDWRDNEGEIVQLVEYDPAHPGIPPEKLHQHTSYLVTNGQFKGSVMNAIQQRNITWARRNLGPLICVAKDELVTRFLKAEGHFFPTAIEDVAHFFELFTDPGELPFDKDKFASFLEAVIPRKQGFDGKNRLEKRHVLQSSSSIVLFTSYILKNKVLAANYWACFEAWTMAAAYIASIGEEHRTAWHFSFGLCLLQAKNALGDLAVECDENVALSQGPTLSDVLVHPTRRVIVSGLMSAFWLATTGDLDRSDQRQAALRVILREGIKPAIWGEGAFSFVFLTILALEQSGRQRVAEGIAVSCINVICRANNGGEGLPNPYWGIERCLRKVNGLGGAEVERFKGFSYCLEPFVEFVARRWLRTALRLSWEQITRVIYATTVLSEPDDWLLWSSGTAKLLTERPNSPESWEQLRDRAERRSGESLPLILRNCRDFALFFSVVYPHRLHVSTTANLDRLI